MTSCVFAFGPDNCWFMETPSVWKWGTLPPAILNRLADAAGGAKVTHVHNMVFGANGSYMIAWRGKDGKNYQANSGLPADLTAWLNKKDSKGFLTRSVPNLRLTLGPNNASYFVTDGKDYLWKNLPPSLSSAIEKLRKKGGGFTYAPRVVALGVSGSYVMITAGNGGSWNVADEYPELNSWISNLKAANGDKGGMFARVTHVSLDAFARQNCVITTLGGGYQAWAPDEILKDLAAVLDSLPKGTPARRQAQRTSSSAIGGILKLASMVLNAEVNSMNGGGGGYNGGGGDYNSGGWVDTTQASMDFTQGLQNQTWSSVDSAATNWNVQ